MLLLFKRSESLECANIFFLSWVSPFSIAESTANILIYITIREDMDRHIPQKIDEFSSLALAGRYP